MSNFICGFFVEVTAHFLLIRSMSEISEHSLRQKNDVFFHILDQIKGCKGTVQIILTFPLTVNTLY